MRTLAEAGYVLAVTVMAAYGFAGETPAPILLAALLTLPTSVVTVPGYYLAYGLWALIPGANPPSGASYGGCSPEGDFCYEHTTGGLAPWFVVLTDTLGVLALAGAALVNVVLLRMLTCRRRPVDHDFAGRPPGW